MARRMVRVDPGKVEQLRMAQFPEGQEALAGKAGLAQTTISRMENSSGPFELPTVEKVARALGVALDEILLPHEDAVDEDNAEIALRAVLEGYGRSMGARARRKFARSIIRAGQKLLDGELPRKGTVNPVSYNRPSVRLSGSRKSRVAAGMG